MLKNRDDLKKNFSEGSRPTAGHFSDLIDSTVNKIEDGFSKSPDNGLMLAPEGDGANRLMSFYKDISDDFPAWVIGLNPQPDVNGLTISQPDTTGRKADDSKMFFDKNGNIGMHTLQPAHDLHVNGVAGMSERRGTFSEENAVPANGQWHTILSGLTGCQAFEVMAHASKEKHGKHALLHATALNTFGKRRIRRTQAHYGFWWNRIAIRWRGSAYNYSLQVKTWTDYGEKVMINYCITRLWESNVAEQPAPVPTKSKTSDQP